MEIIIDKTNSDQRFDRFLRKWMKVYPSIRLADIYALIRKGDAKVNTKRQKEQYRLCVGDVVSIREESKLGDADFSVLVSNKERQMQKLDEQKIRSWVVFEDEHRLVFNKPA